MIEMMKKIDFKYIERWGHMAETCASRDLSPTDDYYRHRAKLFLIRVTGKDKEDYKGIDEWSKELAGFFKVKPNKVKYFYWIVKLIIKQNP